MKKCAEGRSHGLVGRGFPARRLRVIVREMRGTLLVAGAACAWGAWSLVLRPAERAAAGALPAVLQVLVVQVVTMLIAFPFALHERSAAARPPRAPWLLALFGVTDALNALTFFAAMQASSVAIAVLSHYLAPLFVALAAPRILGESPPPRLALALAAALGGLVLLLEPWRGAVGAIDRGAALGALSALFYAANVLLSRGLARWYSAPEILAWHHVPGVALLALCTPPAAWHALTQRSLTWLVLGGVLLGGGAGLAFMRGVRLVAASRASVLTLAEPVVAVALGVLVWSEPLRPLGFAGAGLVVAGAWLVLRG